MTFSVVWGGYWAQLRRCALGPRIQKEPDELLQVVNVTLVDCCDGRLLQDGFARVLRDELHEQRRDAGRNGLLVLVAASPVAREAAPSTLIITADAALRCTRFARTARSGNDLACLGLVEARFAAYWAANFAT